MEVLYTCPVRFFRTIILSAALCAVPAAAFAMQETVWDFRNRQLPGNWKISGVETPATLPEGMLIRAPSEDGSVITDVALPHPVDAISVTFLSDAQSEAMFLWHVRGTPEGTLVQLPFILPAAQEDRPVTINASAFAQWDPRADEIGFTLPKGSAVLLREIRFMHWNFFERAVEAARSFWKFDVYQPYSINFVWGPLLTFNPLGTQELFTTLPPRGRSANGIFYGLAALAGIALAGHWYARRHAGFESPLSRLRIGHAAPELAAFFLCFGALWVLYDVRMGAEMLSYVHKDATTWITPASGNRTFRGYGNFNDVEELVRPALEGEKEYAFLAPPQSPFLAMMRYFSYPAVPVSPDGPRDDLRTWLVFAREDVTVDAEGRVTVSGTPVSKPGKIVQRFDDVSFLFQSEPVPEPEPKPQPQP